MKTEKIRMKMGKLMHIIGTSLVGRKRDDIFLVHFGHINHPFFPIVTRKTAKFFGMRQIVTYQNFIFCIISQMFFPRQLKNK